MLRKALFLKYYLEDTWQDSNTLVHCVIYEASFVLFISLNFLNESIYMYTYTHTIYIYVLFYFHFIFSCGGVWTKTNKWIRKKEPKIPNDSKKNCTSKLEFNLDWEISREPQHKAIVKSLEVASLNFKALPFLCFAVLFRRTEFTFWMASLSFASLFKEMKPLKLWSHHFVILFLDHLWKVRPAAHWILRIA